MTYLSYWFLKDFWWKESKFSWWLMQSNTSTNNSQRYQTHKIWKQSKPPKMHVLDRKSIVWIYGSRSQGGCKVGLSWGGISFIPLVWSLWEQEVHYTGSQERALHVQNTVWYRHPLHPSHLGMVQALSVLCLSPEIQKHSGSNCGVTTCSLFPPEKCWREQVWDRKRSAAFCRAGKQENFKVGGAAPWKV